MVAFEVGSFEFFNASTDRKNKARIFLKTFFMKGALNNEPAFFFVQLVTHTFGEFLEFTFGFCVISIDHEILKVP